MNELLKIVVKELDDKMATNIQIIDLQKISPFSDYFVIVTANNQRLANAMFKSVVEKAAEHNYPTRAVEGTDDSEWILVDLYDVVVHIFVNEARTIYQLEKLWGDLPRVNIDDL